MRLRSFDNQLQKIYDTNTFGELHILSEYGK